CAGLEDGNEPWASAFAGSPSPFGSGPAAPGIAAVSSGAPSGAVHRYYSFDATQNGGKVRVIVLDNSEGSLEASDAGQTQWLAAPLHDGGRHGRPAVR